MMNYSIIEPVQVEIVPTQGTFLHLPTICIKLTILRLTTDESAFLALFIVSSIPAAMRKGFYSTFRKYLAVLTGYRLKNIHRSTSFDCLLVFSTSSLYLSALASCLSFLFIILWFIGLTYIENPQLLHCGLATISLTEDHQIIQAPGELKHHIPVERTLPLSGLASSLLLYVHRRYKQE